MAIIRACVAADLTYQMFLTWYDDGTVVSWQRGSDYTEVCDGVHTLVAFNELLSELEVYPLGWWRRQRREPETELMPF